MGGLETYEGFKQMSLGIALGVPIKLALYIGVLILHKNQLSELSAEKKPPKEIEFKINKKEPEQVFIKVEEESSNSLSIDTGSPIKKIMPGKLSAVNSDNMFKIEPASNLSMRTAQAQSSPLYIDHLQREILTNLNNGTIIFKIEKSSKLLRVNPNAKSPI